MRCLALILILSASACQVPPTSAPTQRFEIGGQPVHPGCVFELSCALSDPRPIAAAVDVLGCMRSDRHETGLVTLRNGGVWYRHPELFESGYFVYWHIGTTPTGVHVLETGMSGGGSGVFGNVLFVTLRSRPFLETETLEARWVLSSLGEISLGDRSGKTLMLEEDVLVIRSPDGSENRLSVPKP